MLQPDRERRPACADRGAAGRAAAGRDAGWRAGARCEVISDSTGGPVAVRVPVLPTVTAGLWAAVTSVAASVATSMAKSMAESMKAGARTLPGRRARISATAACALLWSLLAVLQGTARGSDGHSAQPWALTVATAVLVLVVSVVLWLAAFGTPAPAVGFLLTGLTVVVPLLLVVALRTGLWSHVGVAVEVAVGAGTAALLDAR